MNGLELELASHVILGYRLLTEEQRDAFEKSSEGQQFVQFIKNAAKKIQPQGIIQGLKDWVWGSTEKKDQIIKELKTISLPEDLLKSEAYKKLSDAIDKINLSALDQIYPDIKYLDPSEKLLVAKKFAGLLNKFILAARVLEEERENDSFNTVDTLKQRKQDVAEEWYTAFSTDSNMSALRVKIAQGKAADRIKSLAKFFPFLTKHVESFRNAYNQELNRASANDTLPNFDQFEENFITDLLLKHLNEQRLDFITLDVFNKEQAKLLTKKILKALKNNEKLEMSTWLDEYQVSLTAYIQEQLQLINGKPWKKLENPINSEATQALSYIWNVITTTPFVKTLGSTKEACSSKIADTIAQLGQKAQDYTTRIGDAYSVIQYMGGTAQCDNPLFAFIDAYNLHRTAGELSKFKQIIFGIIKVFGTLYEEYNQIARYEKSPWKKILRAAMPLLVVSGLVILIFALLAPLALPELVSIIIAAPVLLVGLFLATQYVNLKNNLDRIFRNWLYGGPYSIPEFQINDRMISALGDSAETVRNIYITEMQICDAKEAEFKKYESSLTTAQINERRENLSRKTALFTEFFDMHSNTSLGIEKGRLIAKERLNLIAKEQYQELQDKLNLEGKKIDEYIKQEVDYLKISLSVGVENKAESQQPSQANRTANPSSSQTSNASAPQSNNGEKTQVSDSRLASKTRVLKFFQPTCLKNKEKLTEIARAQEALANAPHKTRP